jgi:hypothetical protein
MYKTWTINLPVIVNDHIALQPGDAVYQSDNDATLCPSGSTREHLNWDDLTVIESDIDNYLTKDNSDMIEADKRYVTRNKPLEPGLYNIFVVEVNENGISSFYVVEEMKL